MNAPMAYLVDDDSSVRDAMTLFLALNGVPTRPFASPEDFLRAYNDEWVGCALLDLHMPGMHGLQVQQALQARKCNLPIIVITAHGDVATTRAAMKAGAFDFLEKPVENDVLLDVTRRAMAEGESRKRSSAERATRAARIARLTTREREVMALIAAGQQHREIAAELGISPRTVEVYRARLMEKLEARSLAELIRISLEDDGA
jgi:FixJ family two-component response regulator